MKKNGRCGLLVVLLFVMSMLFHACVQRPDPDSVSAPDEPLNFENIPDGTHRGIFTYGGFNYIVEVVAQGGEVTDIVIVANKDNDPSREAEAVIDRVIEEQSLQVDMVSGATVSSRALLRAVENAITRAIQQ